MVEGAPMRPESENVQKNIFLVNVDAMIQKVASRVQKQTRVARRSIYKLIKPRHQQFASKCSFITLRDDIRPKISVTCIFTITRLPTVDYHVSRFAYEYACTYADLSHLRTH